jgi:tRNA(Arg) A34 adenosine deaminase TadA
MNQKFILEFADTLAKCNNTNYKVAAIIVYKNSIISYATNSYKKTHPLQAFFRKKFNNQKITDGKIACVHAEISAIARILGNRKYDLSKCKIYVSRIDKQGNRAISKPCVECFAAIRYYQFKECIYYNKEGEIIRQYLKGY